MKAFARAAIEAVLYEIIVLVGIAVLIGYVGLAGRALMGTLG